MRGFLILLLFIVTYGVQAQLYTVTRYADDNGLPSRMIRDVDQDKDGFLWIAGNNGLFKFDGQQFRSYYTSLKDTTGLRDNKINTLIAGSDGKIWIATPKGLHILEDEYIEYVYLPDQSNDAQNHIVSLFEDSRHNIWIGTYGGLFVFDYSTKQFSFLSKKQPEVIGEKVIWGITEDQNGTIWVSPGFEHPVIAKNGSFHFQTIPLHTAEFDAAKINPFKYLHYKNNTYLVNSGTGLYKGIFKNDSLLISRFKDEKGFPTATHFLYNTIIADDGSIWNATYRNKFKKYRIKEGYLIEQEVQSVKGLQGMYNHAISIFEDSQNNIWIPNTNGLFKLTKDQGKVHIFPPIHLVDCLPNLTNIFAITEDANGYAWITTPDALFRLDKQDILAGRCPTNYLYFDDIQFSRARRLFIDSHNRLWLSGKEGIAIAQLDEHSIPGEFKHYTQTSGLPHNWSYEVIEENDSTFWVGNYIRLLKMTFPNGDYASPAFKTYDADLERSDALINSFVLNLEQDASGHLWAGTFAGLSRLVAEENKGVFKNYKSVFGNPNALSNNSIKKIFKDRIGRLWIGTQTGLNLYDPKRDAFTQFGREEGLPSDYILDIAEDSNDQLWIATTLGIAKTRYSDSLNQLQSVDHYTSRDGLADNTSNKNALFIDKEDNVFIGSGKGLSVLHNNKKPLQARPFNLAITTIESIKKSTSGFVSIRDKLIDQKIKLPYSEGSIKLSYAVLDFTAPHFNRYRYKILPISEDWIHTGNSAELTFYNLSPGTYELILDGSNSQGMWCEDPITIQLTIAQPFWKSAWAWLLYTLLITAILRYFYVVRIRKRVRQLEQETRLEKALVQEREQLRKENTADFHDELGSKVTKLSLFLTLAERSLQEHKDPSEWFKKIRGNIKDLSGGFRDLLWVIDPQKDSLSDAILRLKDFGEELFDQSQVDFRVSGYKERLYDVILDPQTKKQIVMIFKEAIHNSAKYAHASVIQLDVMANGLFSSVSLTDDGTGFSIHQKSKGRGLKNMRDRAEKIKAQLDITSDQKGTSVVLSRIPHMRDKSLTQ